MRKIIVLAILLLLAGCARVPRALPDKTIPNIAETPQVQKAEVVLVTEKSKEGVVASEKTLVAGKPELENWGIDNGMLMFINSGGAAYRAPVSKIVYREGNDRLDYNIVVGDHLTIPVDGKIRLIRYLQSEETKRKLVFTDGDSRIEAFYDPVYLETRALVGRAYGQRSDSNVTDVTTWDDVRKLNPKITFDEYADTQTIGSGEVNIGGKLHKFYIGYQAGTPLSFDLDGDGKIDGKKIIITTVSGDKVDLDKSNQMLSK